MKQHRFSFPSAEADAIALGVSLPEAHANTVPPAGYANALRLRDAPRWRSLSFALTGTLRKRQA